MQDNIMQMKHVYKRKVSFIAKTICLAMPMHSEPSLRNVLRVSTPLFDGTAAEPPEIASFGRPGAPRRGDRRSAASRRPRGGPGEWQLLRGRGRARGGRGGPAEWRLFRGRSRARGGWAGRWADR